MNPPAQAADAALQPDRLACPFSFSFSSKSTVSLLLIALDFHGFCRDPACRNSPAGLMRSTLSFPRPALLEELAFVNQQLPPDHFVARPSWLVAAEVDGAAT